MNPPNGPGGPRRAALGRWILTVVAAGHRAMARVAGLVWMAVVAVIVALASPGALATSYYFPKFGPPVVAGSSLVFAEPGHEPHRIISVDRESGAKHWEMADLQTSVRVWSAPSDGAGTRCVVTKSNALYFCNVSSGATVFAYRTDLQLGSILLLDGSRIVVAGERGNVDVLQLIDLEHGVKLWELLGIQGVSSSGGGLLLCDRASRLPSPQQDGGYQLVNQGVAAVSEESGVIAWQRTFPRGVPYSTSVRVGTCFVTEYSGVICCFDQASGALLNSIRLWDTGTGRACIAARGEGIVAWVQVDGDGQSGGMIQEISVPKLQRRLAVRTEGYAARCQVVGGMVIGSTIGGIEAYRLGTKRKVWKGGQWAWNGIHDGCIYYSAMDEDGQHAVVNRIRVETGETKLLYREALRK